MAGTIGIWGNYQTGKIFEIDEHERWLRTGNNAEKLGISKSSMDDFDDFKPIEDRDKFLLEIIHRNPVMRVREHSNYATFEFDSYRIEKPLELISKICDKLGMGMYSGLYIINHANNQSASLNYQDFRKKSQYADKIEELSESFEPFETNSTEPTLAKRLGCKPMTAAEHAMSESIGHDDNFKKLNESYHSRKHFCDAFHDFLDIELEADNGKIYIVDFQASYDYHRGYPQTMTDPEEPEEMEFHKLESVDSIAIYDDSDNKCKMDMKDFPENEQQEIRDLCEEYASEHSDEVIQKFKDDYEESKCDRYDYQNDYLDK